MLILYPEDNWNTFIDEVTMEEAILSMTDGAKWNALSQDERYRLMITATMLIASVSDVTGGCPFMNAQAMLVIFDLENDGKYLSFTATSGGEYKRAKVGSLEVEYNLDKGSAGLGGGASGLPEVVRALLRDCLFDGAGAQGFTLV